MFLSSLEDDITDILYKQKIFWKLVELGQFRVGDNRLNSEIRSLWGEGAKSSILLVYRTRISLRFYVRTKYLLLNLSFVFRWPTDIGNVTVVQSTLCIGNNAVTLYFAKYNIYTYL